MKAFHGKKELKQKYLERVEHHIQANNLVRGMGWENGKGGAVGCTLESYDHDQYELQLGIPEWLARVEDTLFDCISFSKSKTWPRDFLAAINVGADLGQIKTPFILKILESNLETLDTLKVDEKLFPEVAKSIEGSKRAVKNMIHARRNNLDLTAARSEARSAALSAESAAWSAWSARLAEWSAVALSAAESAALSAALSAAESAAESAAWSARSAEWSTAEWSTAQSAKSAAWSTAWSAAEWPTAKWLTAESAKCDQFADDLLKLLKDCKWYWL